MKIETLHDFHQALEHGPYAWPGGYPCYFLMEDGEAVSYEAARENYEKMSSAVVDRFDASGWKPVALEINWEDPDLYCAASNERIPSAYAEEKNTEVVAA